MTRMRLTTYQDCIDHLVDYLGGSTGDDTVRFARRAVQDAYNHLPSLHSWSYLKSRGRISTVVPQTTGTITYTHATLTVLLAGSTWPSWVLQGVLVINNIPYQIATNPSSTTITLSPQCNPGADVAALTAYTLYQDAYSLPIDFTECDEFQNITNGSVLSFEHPADWLSAQRVFRTTACPRMYTIIGSPGYFGAMAARLFPAPDAVYALDFVYKRRPRQLDLALYTLGTVSTTSGSVTVTGSGTNWTSQMVGSVIRFSSVGNNVPPTGPSGENPFSIERTILAVASTTSLTVDADPALTASGQSYSISDPLDIEEQSMLSFFLRLMEKQIRRARRINSTPEESADYKMSLTEAQEADNRSTARSAVGPMRGGLRQLRDYPSGADQG